MAKFASKVVATFTIMLLMGLKAQGVPVSFSNGLSPLTDLHVHCRKDAQDALTQTISPWKEHRIVIPMGFFGTYICDFAAEGRRTTTFDVINTKCNCNSFYGCAWVAKNEGFYCNFAFIRRWA